MSAALIDLSHLVKVSYIHLVAESGCFRLSPIRLKHNKRPIVLFVVRSMHLRHHYPGPFASYPGPMQCTYAVFDPHPTVSYSSDPVRSRPSWPLKTISASELQKKRLQKALPPGTAWR